MKTKSDENPPIASIPAQARAIRRWADPSWRRISDSGSSSADAASITATDNSSPGHSDSAGANRAPT